MTLTAYKECCTLVMSNKDINVLLTHFSFGGENMLRIDRLALAQVIADDGRNVSQIQRAAGLTPSTVYRLLKADRPCRISTVGALARELGVTVSEITKEG